MCEVSGLALPYRTLSYGSAPHSLRNVLFYTFTSFPRSQIPTESKGDATGSDMQRGLKGRRGLRRHRSQSGPGTLR